MGDVNQKRHAFLPHMVRIWAIASSCIVGVVLAQSVASDQAFGQTTEASRPLSLTEMQKTVSEASKPNPAWDGPRSGPKGVTEKSVAIIAEDLRNGGILGVAQGVDEAAKILKWNVKVFDAGGTPGGRDKAVADALAFKPQGVVLIGASAQEMASRLKGFAEKNIPIVGWHVGPKAGPLKKGPVAVNISTDPLEVARITAMAAVTASKGKAGVVIFTDSNFEIAMAKANAMAAVIKACKGCTLLEMRDVAISKNAELMPGVTRELLTKYGKRWTHALAINDIYFDYAVPELTKTGLPRDGISLLSAGDGSAPAFMRIQAKTFQTGTVAEPLNLHGWQLVDELNRLIARQELSAYVAPVHIITTENIGYDGGPEFRYDPDNGYRDIYQRIWKH